MTRKTLPPPSGGDQLQSALRARHKPTTTAPSPDRPVDTDRVDASASGRRSAAENRSPATNSTSSSSTPANRPMVRRSWYMTAATADALSEFVDELHHTTRRPKHETWSALLAVVSAREAEVRERLTS